MKGKGNAITGFAMGHQKLLWIGLVLAMSFTAGCISSTDTPENIATRASNVNLLFAYSPSCPHCAYQKPIISEFERKHSEIKVTWVEYYALNDEQRRLVEGTSGHPVMVFYNGDYIRQVVGETSRDALEDEYEAFKRQLEKTESSIITTGSYKRCR